MKLKFLILTLLISANAFAVETETVGVKGMVCSFCAQGITKKFKALPEVASVDVSLEKKIVKLTYNEGKKLSHEQIATLLKESGYEVSFDGK